MSEEILDRRMAERCATCAFRSGTEANKQPTTQLKAKLCIAAGNPFLCHESPLPAWCAGVADALEAKIGNGGEIEGGWKQEVRLALLEHIDEIEADPFIGTNEMDRRLHGRIKGAMNLSRGNGGRE